MVVGELGKVCLKEHSESLFFRPSSLLAFLLPRGFNVPFMMLHSGR
jgi:hypothetical protein